MAIKAKALGFLFQFDQSRALLQEPDFAAEIGIINQLEAQANGDYHEVLADVETFLEDDKILNYI